MLEYGALVILIYACMYGPIIAGVIAAFKMPGKWPKIIGAVIAIFTIVMTVVTFMQV